MTRYLLRAVVIACRSFSASFVVASILLFGIAAASAADPLVETPQLAFPTPALAVGADNGENDFHDRAKLVINANACGREPDFATHRQTLANDKLDDATRYNGQGEDVGPLLSAKVSWLVDNKSDAICQFVTTIRASQTEDVDNVTSERSSEIVNDLRGRTALKYRDECSALKWAEIGGDTTKANQLCGTNAASVAQLQNTRQFAGCVSWVLAFNDSNTTVPPSDPGQAGKITFVDELTVTYAVPWSCLRSQVNDTVQQFKKVGRMGTSFEEGIEPVLLPFGNVFCIGSGKGEYDAELKEHVRLLYLSKAAGQKPDYSILDKTTVDHMFDELLSARGEPAGDKFNVLTDCQNTANEKTGKIEDIADTDEHADNVLGVLAGAADDVVDSAGDVLKFLPKLLEYATELFQKAVIIAAAGTVFGALVLGSAFDGAEWIAAILFAADPAGALGLGAPFDLRVEETENHRLMIESSRYLINADIARRLRDLGASNASEFDKDNNDVAEWLLRRLQSIAKNDFDEYNSRAYTRYSLRAIRNVYDFAPDKDVKTAAKIVLDLAESKFAAGSNLGRRLAPFRRRASADLSNEGDYSVELYHWVDHSDDQVVNAPQLSGQTQLLPFIDINNSDRLVPGATSTYRLPRAALEAIVERKLPFIQVANHDGRESYYSSPVFLMTTGGIRTPAKIGLTILGIPDHDDSGIALPTSIMLTGGRAPPRGWPVAWDGQSSKSTFHFRGIGTQDNRTENLCGWKGFICGVAPHFTEFILPKNPTDPTPARDPKCDDESSHADADIKALTPLTIIYKPRDCQNRPGPPYFMAGRFFSCDGVICDQGQQYGFMEVVPVPPPLSMTTEDKFAAFVRERTPVLDSVNPDADGNATYVTSAGDEIHFNMKQAMPKVLTVNGSDVAGLLGSAATGYSGGLINAHDGVGTIASPWGNEVVEFDFSKWFAPSSIVRSRRFDETVAFFADRNDNTSTLQFFKYLGVASPTGLGMAGPVDVHPPPRMFVAPIPAVGAPVFYTVDRNGDLFWQRSDGAADGTDNWTTVDPGIGNGWTIFDRVIAGEQGTLYGRYGPDQEHPGVLRWYRHLGYKDGSGNWVDGINVGDAAEWSRFDRLIASSDGVIYGLLPNGDLIWHRHLGFMDGSINWATPQKVGNVWQGFKALMSPGCGLIFALNDKGELLRYRHKGYLTGDVIRDGPTVIASGLKSIAKMYAVMPNDHPDRDRCNLQ
jgi:hypothetical protein